jgi:hypothetical protein
MGTTKLLPTTAHQTATTARNGTLAASSSERDRGFTERIVFTATWITISITAKATAALYLRVESTLRNAARNFMAKQCMISMATRRLAAGGSHLTILYFLRISTILSIGSASTVWPFPVVVPARNMEL